VRLNFFESGTIPFKRDLSMVLNPDDKTRCQTYPLLTGFQLAQMLQHTLDRRKASPVMNYTAYSFGALSRLQPRADHADPTPEIRRAAQPSAPKKLTVSEGISAVGVETSWYVRLFRHLHAFPIRHGLQRDWRGEE
jgi:hypothetical protein